MAGNIYHVSFEGMQHAGGLFNSYLFQVAPPASEEAQAVHVHVSTSLQIRLWHAYDTEHEGIMAMAARAVVLHLKGRVPDDAYRDDERATLLLSTNWYPGHPGEPETMPDFEAFEVAEAGEEDASARPSPDGDKS